MDIKSEVIEIIDELFMEDVSDMMDEDLFDAGVLDSMGTVELIVEIENRFDIRVPVTEFGRDDWNLRHCIATRSKAHTCTCHVNKYLCCECRVIDRHIEREVLVVGLTTHTLTSHVNAMTNIVQSCNAWYCKYV